MTRTCSRCDSEKPLEEFRKTGRPNASNGGYEGVCKACFADANAGRIKRCADCQEWKPAERFRLTRVGNRASFCIECRNARQRARKAGEYVPTGDARKKLPDYETLKHLVINKRLSYQAIADQYGVAGGRRKVQTTLRRRAERRGEWPLLSPEQVEQRRMAGRRKGLEVGVFRVKAAVVKELLADYLADHRMMQKDFAAQAGLRADYVHKVLHAKPGGSLSPAYALRILEAIGEPIPVGLRERAKFGPKPFATAPATADGTACATDASADAEEHVA